MRADAALSQFIMCIKNFNFLKLIFRQTLWCIETPKLLQKKVWNLYKKKPFSKYGKRMEDRTAMCVYYMRNAIRKINSVIRITAVGFISFNATWSFHSRKFGNCHNNCSQFSNFSAEALCHITKKINFH